MRFYRTLPQGSSLELTAFFMNRSLASRMLMLGLPLLALVLLIIFAATGSSIESILDRAIARNAQLQSQAMRLALEQALEETRNQLLILAAGSMDEKDMSNRLNFRARAAGLHYRELAFEGLAPDNRYLLINSGGEVINVPLRQALASPTGPFHTISGEQRSGYVSLAQPVEAVYSMASTLSEMSGQCDISLGGTVHSIAARIEKELEQHARGDVAQFTLPLSEVDASMVLQHLYPHHHSGAPCGQPQA